MVVGGVKGWVREMILVEVVQVAVVSCSAVLGCCCWG